MVGGLDDLSVLLKLDSKGFSAGIGKADKSLIDLTKKQISTQRALSTLESRFKQGKVTIDQYARTSAGLRARLAQLNQGLNKTAKSAAVAKRGISGLGAVAKAAFASLAAIAAINVFKGFANAGRELEKNQLQMAGLINATTQFIDEQGKAVNSQENLNQSLKQAKELYSQLQKRAAGLAGVTTEDLQATATFALPDLGSLGITEAEKQAEVIGTITAAIKQLGIAGSQLEFRNEVQMLLQGNVGDANAEFAKLIATTQGGTEAFKRNFEAAKQAGTTYEFLQQSLSAFAANQALASNSLDNSLSVLQDSFTQFSQNIGGQLTPALKKVVDSGIGFFFQKTADGTAQLNQEIAAVATEIGQNLAGALEGIAPIVEPLFKVVTSSLKFITQLVGEVGAAFGQEQAVIGDTLSFIAKGIDFVGNRIGGLVKIIAAAIKVAIRAVINLGKTIAADVQSLINGVISNINAFLSFVTKGINKVISGINLLTQGINKASEGFSKLAGNFGKKINAIKIPKIDKLIPAQIDKIDIGFDRSTVKAEAFEIGQEFGNSFKQGLGQLIEGRTLASRTALPTGGGSILDSITKGGRGQSNNTKPTGSSGGATGGGSSQAQDEQRVAAIKKQTEVTKQLNQIKAQGAALDAENRAKQGNLDFENQKLAIQKRMISSRVEAGELTEKEGKLQAIALEKKMLENQAAKDNLEIKRQEQGIQTQIQQAETERQNAIANINMSTEEGRAKAEEINEIYNQRLEKYQKELESLGIKQEHLTTILGLTKEELGLKGRVVDETDKGTKGVKEQANALEGSFQQAAQGMGNALSGAFQNGKFEAQKFGEAALDVLFNIIGTIANAGIGSIFGGGGGGFLGGLFGGARAGGGPVSAGKTYVVGEKGPELFTPNQSGQIIPNDKLNFSQPQMPNVGSGMVRPNFKGGNVGGQTVNNFAVTIRLEGGDVDNAQKFRRMLRDPSVQKDVQGMAVNAVHRESNRSLNRSTMERGVDRA